LALLQEHGIEPNVVRYLDDPPDAATLRHVLSLLGMAPRELMRRKEQVYADLGLNEVEDDAALVEAMVEHPRLIERPVVIHGDKAAIGRPPEAVLALFESQAPVESQE